MTETDLKELDSIFKLENIDDLPATLLLPSSLRGKDSCSICDRLVALLTEAESY